VPIRWQSEITAWEPPYRFVDEQRRGPYRCWIHEHTFEADGDATVARDRVQYDHIGGRLVNRLMVGPDVRRIFAFRTRVLNEIFGAAVEVDRQ
jgi:ligand-binding SRPBCC domain-containing protein